MPNGRGSVSSMLSAASELQARVGIATGLVVAGDLIGEGSAQEHVDTQEYFIHTAANQNVEACQQARQVQVQVQPSFLRYLEI